MENRSEQLDPSLEKQLKGHRSAITALAYSPNDQQIASGSLDNSILLWDLAESVRSYRFRGHDEAVMDVTFSPTSKHMASASRDKTVRIWVPSVTGNTGVFKAHSQTVRSVQFSPDGSKIITASDDKIVKLWSSEKYRFIASFVGHTNWVRCARMSNDGSVIASCSDDKTARLWNPDSGDLINTYKDQKGHGLCLAWHPSGCYIAVGTSHGNVKLYDVRTHNLVQYYSIHNDGITNISFHPSGSYVITSSRDGKMKVQIQMEKDLYRQILDLLEGHPIFTLCGHTGAVNAVAFSQSGESFASAGDDKLVNIWKTNFTELATEVKENVTQNPTVFKTASKTSTASRAKNQGKRSWHLCYHNAKIPVSTFTHMDDVADSSYGNESSRLTSVREHPNANSTLIEPSDNAPTWSSRFYSTTLNNFFNRNRSQSTSRDAECQSPNHFLNMGQSSDLPHQPPSFADHPSCSVGHNLRRPPVMSVNEPTRSKRQCHTSCSPELNSSGCSSYSVGHISHIPRSRPPKPGTYTVPSIISRTIGTEMKVDPEDDMFGLIKLKKKDVCYTSGTIEWVGRKRTFPINSGFKVLDGSLGPGDEPLWKKSKGLDKSNTCGTDNFEECDCADVLPTVNALVDHLNALHEAVDIVDLRLTTLETVASANN